MNKAVKKRLRIAFLIYMAVLLYLLLFSERNIDGTNGYNVQLLAEIRRYIRYREILGMKLVVRNLVGNIVGFLPFGFLLPVVNSSFEKLLKTVTAAGFLSLMIEVAQLITGVGCFDVDDVLLNTLGGFIGYILWLCYTQIRKYYGKSKKEEKEI